MRTKVTLVLIFLNVALFFFIFKFERTWRTEAASLEARRRVLGPEAADIRSLEVSSTAAGGSYALVRERETWMLTKPLEWPANPHAVSAILNELRLLQHETSFPTKDLEKSGQTLADFGLDKPKMTLAFTSGDPAASSGPLPPTILRIGDTTKAARLYLLSPNGDRIHVVRRSLVDTLSLSVEQLRADELLTIRVHEARLLNIQTGSTDEARGGSAAAGARVRVRRDGPRWTFETPIIERASRTALEITINQLNSLRAKTFNPVPPPSAPPATAFTLRVGIEGNNRHETLFLGEPVGGAAAVPAGAKEVEYYAQLEKRAPLFTVMVPTALVDTLRGASESLRERRILDFEPAMVTSITLAGPDPAQPPITLQRLENPGPGAEGTQWQVVRRGGTAEGPQTLPADRAAVERLLTQLAQLSARSFVSDNPSGAQREAWGFNRPEREITLTVAAGAPSGLPVAPPVTTGSPTPAAPTTSVVLRLGTDSSGQVYARVGNATNPGSSIYAVEVDLRTLFPVEQAAWRDRALLALPANARITAVKLTDLASGQVIFETTVDASGQPAAGGRDVQDIQAVLAGLRAPRARSFRPEPLADRLFIGGEDRAWRYQLDATVALPGREQTDTRTLLLMDRTGGAQQLAGSREFNAVFEIEQSLIDALRKLIDGPRDPGPPSAPAPNPAATAPSPPPAPGPDAKAPKSN